VLVELARTAAAGTARVKVLDASSVEHAVRRPESFRAADGPSRALVGGSLPLELSPFAVARIDVS
jgi:hypothetical protein